MKTLTPLVLVAPLVILYAMLAGLPVASILVKSFTQNHNLDLELFSSQTLRTTAWTLENYALLLTEPYYLIAIWNTVLVAGSAVAISVVLGVPIAYQLSRPGGAGRLILEWVISLPIYVSGVLASYALLLVFSRRGLFGALSGAFLDSPASLIGTVVAIIAGTVYIILPMFVRIARAGFLSVPGETFEASLTLGAGEWTTFRKIMLPQALPAIGAAVAITFTYAMSLVVVILVLGSGGATFTILPLEILSQTRSTNLDIPLAAAMAIVLLIVAALGQLIAERSLAKVRRTQPAPQPS